LRRTQACVIEWLDPAALQGGFEQKPADQRIAPLASA